jgi:hypothetical protein
VGGFYHFVDGVIKSPSDIFQMRLNSIIPDREDLVFKEEISVQLGLFADL